jgi:hypothetical protein
VTVDGHLTKALKKARRVREEGLISSVALPADVATGEIHVLSL